MKKRYLIGLGGLCLACQAGLAQAEGFSLTQWSSRGLALAGGMVARADDPSTLAYNAAGMTQLSGTRVMGGIAVDAPRSTINARMNDGQRESATTRFSLGLTPHAYMTRQLDDRLWVGMGMFSRFGLDNAFSDNWIGRYQLSSVQFQTYSFVPSLALKVNEAVSLSAGLEVMYADFAQSKQIPSLQMIGYFPQKGPDSKQSLTGTGWGAGLHLGAHVRLTDALSLGVAYKSPVTLHMSGKARYSLHQPNHLAEMNEVPHTIDTDTHSTVHLPDSLSLGLAYKPAKNLSIEVGTVFTRWSKYDSLAIAYDSGFDFYSKKNWRDGWNINASLEYLPREWLALRAGVWHETPVVDKRHADFMLTRYGNTGLGLGAGMTWGKWTLDLAYAHRWGHQLTYKHSDADGVLSSVSNIRGGRSEDTRDNIYSVTLSYAF